MISSTLFPVISDGNFGVVVADVEAVAAALLPEETTRADDVEAAELALVPIALKGPAALVCGWDDEPGVDVFANTENELETVPVEAGVLVVVKPEKPEEAGAVAKVDAEVGADEVAGLKTGKVGTTPAPVELSVVVAGMEALEVVVTVENKDEEGVPKTGFEAGVAEKAGADAGG